MQIHGFSFILTPPPPNVISCSHKLVSSESNSSFNTNWPEHNCPSGTSPALTFVSDGVQCALTAATKYSAINRIIEINSLIFTEHRRSTKGKKYNFVETSDLIARYAPTELDDIHDWKNCFVFRISGNACQVIWCSTKFCSVMPLKRVLFVNNEVIYLFRRERKR